MPATTHRLIASFYHDPPLWVGERPVRDTVDDEGQPPTVSFELFNKEVTRWKLDGRLELRVSVDGLFAFDFVNWPPAYMPNNVPSPISDFDAMADEAINKTHVMNAYLAFLYTRVYLEDNAAIDAMVVTPELLIPMATLDGDDRMSLGSVRVEHLLMSRFESTYALHPLVDDRIRKRIGPISATAIEHAAEDLSNVLSNGREDVLLLDLFLRGAKAFSDHNYSLGLITHWAIVEKLINVLWKQTQTSKPPKAAHMNDKLHSEGHIEQDLYSNLTTVRRARNDWMHDLGPVDAVTAGLARDVCEKLLKQVKGYEVRSAGLRRIHQ